MKFDWENIPTIHGSHVSLRLLTRADRDSLYAIYSHAQVMRYWGAVPMKNPSDVKDFVEEVSEDLRLRKCIQWGIARRADDLIIGTFALFGWDPVARKCEVGFALGRPYWGMGYMHEALQVAFGFIFNELDVRRIEADVDPRNTPSIRLLERLGFQKEGYLRERWLIPGETQDALFYGLLKREWNSTGVPYEVVSGAQPPQAAANYSGGSLRAWRGLSHLCRWVRSHFRIRLALRRSESSSCRRTPASRFVLVQVPQSPAFPLRPE